MKRKHTILSALPAACSAFFVLLAGCTPSAALPGEGEAAPLQVGSLQTMAGGTTATRAVTVTDYPTTGSIGFFVKEDAANGYDMKNNVEGTYNTTSLTWQPVDPIWLNAQDVTVAVYAPYDANQYAAGDTPANGTLKLTAGLRTDNSGKERDLWYKRSTANNLNSRLDLTLEHVYTRFIISVTKDVVMPDTEITGVTVKGTDIYPAAVFNPLEDAPYTLAKAKKVSPAVAAQTIDATHPTADYDLLLIPATLTDSITVGFTIDGSDMTLKLPPTDFENSKLEAGRQYRLAAKLTVGVLEVVTVIVEEWEFKPNVSGGDISYTSKPPLPYFDLGLDFYIAPANLTATAAHGLYSYAFAKEQSYYSGDGSAGDYFLWNMLEPTLTATTANSGEWIDSNDPCRQVYVNWHIPREDQLQDLIDMGHCPGTWIDNSGTPVDGMYFGTATPPNAANQDKYLFLPAAGCFDGTNKKYDGMAHLGLYWSMSILNNISRSLYFVVANPVVVTDNINTGNTIRCVWDK